MIKIFTFLMTLYLAVVGTTNYVLADVINQEHFKTHLRWNLVVPKDQVYIVKKGQTLHIETVNLQVFENLISELNSLQVNKQYIDKINSSKNNFPARPATIYVELKDPSVELFSFYRDADKKYILDFWINTDLISEKTAALQKSLPPLTPVPEEKPKKFVEKKIKAKEPQVNKNDLLVRKGSILPIVEVSTTSSSKVNPDYRDIRYGASFIWDYKEMIPQLEKDINLASKIPEYLYPIKDRDKLDDPKEAHLQLTINFYKEEKWGLMNKSLTLYEKKYGRDNNHVINEFIKANALLKGNLSKPNKGITQSAMAILSNIKDLTEDYDLKSGILRYLIQYNLDNKDNVKALELTKQLFVEARATFDQTIVIQTALTILHCLAELKQVDKIEEFLADKKLASILPPQMGMAYSTYSMLTKNQTKDIVKRYKSVEKSLVKPVHPSILFNVAESYFRNAEYEEAIKIYDEFLSTYSYLLQSPHVRLRLALVYELLDRPSNENLVLYKNAIDRSTNPEVRYEAKLRYVAYRMARKIKLTNEDREVEVFLEQSPDESKAMNNDLKKLLWLVRLRLFISNKEYDKAISYLTSIPLDSLRPADRRVFEGDGAEIIFGLIQDAYLKEDYAKVVKLWEVYKNKYEAKVAKNLYMNFVVCDSYLKLGLYKSYDRALDGFKMVQGTELRTFPIWVERIKTTNLSEMIEELNLIRTMSEKKYDTGRDMLASFPVSLRDSINFYLYSGLMYFQQQKYQEAVGEFEKVLVKQNPQNQLTPRQMADLLMSYVESLYQLKDQNRFKTIVKALSNDIDKSKSAQILNISERIKYLLIEVYAGETGTPWNELEEMTKSFKEKFQKSPYSARVGYLYGLSLIKNEKVADGQEILKNLTNDAKVPSHIKEMCRSELAALELANKKFN